MDSVQTGNAKSWLFLAITAVVLVLASTLLAAPGRSLLYSLQPDRLEAFSLELTQVVSTDFEGLASDQLEGAPPPDTGWGSGAVTTRVRGELQRYVARVFRDGTLGLVSRVRALDAVVERGEQPSTHDLAAVDGRSVSLRVNGTGEILDSFGWRQLRAAGVGELLDDAFLQSMVRLPPVVPQVGSPTAMTFRLEVPVEDGLHCDQTWVLSFKATEGLAPKPCPGRCMLLEYAGTVRESCRDLQRGMERTGEAEAGGRLALKRVGGKVSLYSHHWRLLWQRQLEVRVAAGQPQNVVRQSVSTSGSLTATEPSR